MTNNKIETINSEIEKRRKEIQAIEKELENKNDNRLIKRKENLRNKIIKLKNELFHAVMQIPLNKEEYKDMHEYIDKEIRPMVTAFLKEVEWDEADLDEYGKVDSCIFCEQEVHYEDVTFNTFNLAKCPHCGKLISPCGLCRDACDYNICEKCPIVYAYNKRMENN